MARSTWSSRRRSWFTLTLSASGERTPPSNVRRHAIRRRAVRPEPPASGQDVACGVTPNSWLALSTAALVAPSMSSGVAPTKLSDVTVSPTPVVTTVISSPSKVPPVAFIRAATGASPYAGGLTGRTVTTDVPAPGTDKVTLEHDATAALDAACREATFAGPAKESRASSMYGPD